MLKNTFILLFTFVISAINAQHKNIILNNFYKNEFLRYSKNKSLETFFPANETQLNLTDSIKDTIVYYYDLPVWFFQKHWLEINKNDGKIHLSPLVNFAYGKNLNPLNAQTLFRNTRGFYLEGELLKKISFNFILSENQAAFMDYEARYFDSNGEFYVGLDSSYSKVNAVIPSGARTKPFKSGALLNAYDYAFSIGSIAWSIKPNLRIEVGNNQHFIGVGYRSILLSDNSTHAPYLKINWKISPKISFQYLAKKHQNLYRKPSTYGVESAYEKKLYTATYLTYQAKNNFSISLFSAGNQLRTDSISKYPIQIQQFLPFTNNDLFYSSSKINGIQGVNTDFSLNNFRFYAQIAFDKYKKTYLSAYQIGLYYFNVLNIKFLDIQFEFNSVPENFYASTNTKLAYSHSNLPSAHPKGNDFNELIFALNFEWKRIYISLMENIYFTKGYSELIQYANNSIFIADKSNLLVQNGTTAITQGELGYRFNRKYNPTLFLQAKYRKSEFDTYLSKNLMILAGLKVNLFNQYLDF